MENWIIDYDLNQDIHITQVYKNFVNCLKGNARETWIAKFEEKSRSKKVCDMEKLSATIHREYLARRNCSKTNIVFKKTKKPRKASSRNYVRRIKNINSLLPMMGGEKLTEEELVEDVIAQNLPGSWIKPFRLSGSHHCNKIKKVISLKKVLGGKEHLYRNKTHPKNNRNHNKTEQPNQNTKLQNPCKNNRHPNGNHE